MGKVTVATYDAKTSACEIAINEYLLGLGKYMQQQIVVAMHTANVYGSAVVSVQPQEMTTMTIEELLAPGNKGCAHVSISGDAFFIYFDGETVCDPETGSVDSQARARTDAFGVGLLDWYLDDGSAAPSTCRCDLFTVLMVTGCNCGGK